MGANNIIRLAYAIMILGMIFSFILSRNQKKEIRKTVDGFALAFAQLSNLICPRPTEEKLGVDKGHSDTVKAMPMDRQSPYIRSIVDAAMSPQSVSLFQQMVDAEDHLAQKVGKSKRWKEQFLEPVDNILAMTHTFLEGCENLQTINSQEKVKQFNSFLLEQVDHRMVLLRRIRGETAEAYRELNKHYAKEMEAIERAEKETRQKKAGTAAPKEKSTRPKKSERQTADSKSEGSVVPPEKAHEGGPSDANPTGSTQVANEQINTTPMTKEDWHGWGCG